MPKKKVTVGHISPKYRVCAAQYLKKKRKKEKKRKEKQFKKGGVEDLNEYFSKEKI